MFGLISLNSFGFGFKIRMDQTYNSVYKNGEWIAGEILDANSLATASNIA